MENNTYITKDLAEVGMLVIKKQILLRMEREDGICWFVFKDKGKCEQLSSQFFFDEVLVNARDYYEAINRLKNRIFSKY
jgi:hypothetical protein